MFSFHLWVLFVGLKNVLWPENNINGKYINVCFICVSVHTHINPLDAKTLAISGFIIVYMFVFIKLFCCCLIMFPMRVCYFICVVSLSMFNTHVVLFMNKQTKIERQTDREIFHNKVGSIKTLGRFKHFKIIFYTQKNFEKKF